MTGMPGAPPRLERVGAAVLMVDRVDLAQETVRWLLGSGVDREVVRVYVNGSKATLDTAVVGTIEHVQLQTNLGPAGGMARAVRDANDDDRLDWVVLCEDDVGVHLSGLDYLAPALRAARGREGAQVGAVVAYGRRMGAVGRSVPSVPVHVEPELQPVEVAAWGATVVNLAATRGGVSPDETLFFGYEDFDFFLRLRHAGWQVLLHAPVAARLGLSPHPSGRSTAYAGRRRVDDTDPWRRYYEARNFVHLARRHGTWRWRVDHLVSSMKRARHGGPAHWLAIGRGLLDGYRGVTGQDDHYVRGRGA